MNTKNLSTSTHLALLLLILVMTLGLGPNGFGIVEASAKGADAVDANSTEVDVEADGSSEWLADHAIPFTSVEPGSDLTDLASLQTIVGDARIVALGEATHGTSEFFKMKHRILEYLVTRKGFTVFAIEDGMPEAELINHYVLTGEGDPRTLLAGLNAWPWNAQEVLNLIEWMRSYNINRGDAPSVQFAGFDMQTHWQPSSNVINYLQQVDPEQAAQAEANYYCLRKYGTMGYQVFQNYPNEPADVKKQCRDSLKAVYNLLRDHQSAYKKLSSPEEFAWALQNARIMVQYEDMMAAQSPTKRDQYMAENVAWLAKTRYPGARMVLWAHNYHVSMLPGTSMGGFLRRQYGKNIVTIGFTHYRGSFNAYPANASGNIGPMSVIQIDGPFPEGPENALHEIGVPRFILNMRGVTKSPSTEWLFKSKQYSSVGAVFNIDNPRQSNQVAVLAAVFDVLIYIQDTTPSHLLGQLGSGATIPVSQSSSPNPSGEMTLGFEEGMGSWQPSSNQWDAYKADVDRSIFHSGAASGMIQSTRAVPEGGFASLTQQLSAEKYRGKKVRITAFIRAEGVADFAGLWARVDGASGMLRFVNSRNQPIRGSVDWTRVTITINVPKSGDTFLFGALLEGDGRIWVDDVTLEVVN